MTPAPSTTERSYAQVLRAIKKGEDTVLAFIVNMAEMKDRNLWREGGYPTWKAFVEAELPRSVRTANRMVAQGRELRELAVAAEPSEPDEATDGTRATRRTSSVGESHIADPPPISQRGAARKNASRAPRNNFAEAVEDPAPPGPPDVPEAPPPRQRLRAVSATTTATAEDVASLLDALSLQDPERLGAAADLAAAETVAAWAARFVEAQRAASSSRPKRTKRTKTIPARVVEANGDGATTRAKAGAKRPFGPPREVTSFPK